MAAKIVNGIEANSAPKRPYIMKHVQ
jgi:hypothetical protein